MEPVPPPKGRMTPSPEPRLPPPPPPNMPKEPKPKDKSGPLYAKFATPDAPVRKARNPKLIQKGVEMAFRKRQNVKFKEGKADVLECFRRILEEDLAAAGEAGLRALFREASDQLALLGLPLGGTEEWADRLYIEGKGGTLLFSEAELDQAPATICV